MILFKKCFLRVQLIVPIDSKIITGYHHFQTTTKQKPSWLWGIFYKQRLFSTQPQCCLRFPWTQLHMLLRCCLLHITIILLRHILYLVYLCPCLGQVLFMSYLCDPIFIFSLIFIIINHKISLKTHSQVWDNFWQLKTP